MTQYRQQFIVGIIVLIVIAAGVVGWRFSSYQKESAVNNSSSTPEYSEPMVRAPDGTLVQVQTLKPLGEAEFPDPNHVPVPISMGTGTTTLNKATPFNDILIAETGSQYASLRNARYTVWPYPGEIPLKEIYFILPDVYEPIFSGYSDKQFLESMDGQKHVVIYLRHKQNKDIGPDAKIFVQSPISTDEQDHPLTLEESTNMGAIFSIAQRGREVLVEVTFNTPSSISPDVLRAAHSDLLRAVANMEIIW